jgi:hypothetical protein
LRPCGNEPDKLPAYPGQYRAHRITPWDPYTSRKIFAKAFPDGHYTEIIVEYRTKQKYAVDGWNLPSGEEPEIVEVERRYIDDHEIALSPNEAAGLTAQSRAGACTLDVM